MGQHTVRACGGKNDKKNPCPGNRLFRGVAPLVSKLGAGWSWSTSPSSCFIPEKKTRYSRADCDVLEKNGWETNCYFSVAQTLFTHLYLAILLSGSVSNSVYIFPWLKKNKSPRYTDTSLYRVFLLPGHRAYQLWRIESLHEPAYLTFGDGFFFSNFCTPCI